MKTAGIVCEYNPFHTGHKWQVDRVREMGFEAVVCVMSGPFVQRAEPALLPTHTRAAMALAGGVDLVLRLPVTAALRSAEGFAWGAVGVLAALGCVDSLVFGAETPHTAAFEACAALLESRELKLALKEELARGDSFAAARARAAERLLPGAGGLLQSPNNILGVEYCKALQKGYDFCAKGALPRPLALQRTGAAHDGGPLGGIASASWLRQTGRQAGYSETEEYIPKACRPLYRAALNRGEMVEAARWELALLSRLKGLGPGAFARAYGAGEGLENRMAKAASRAASLEGLYSLAKTKRYAASRVRRLAVSAALGLRENEPALPPFIHVLGASGQGRLLLKRAKLTAALPLDTSMARLERSTAAAGRLAAQEALAEDIHALCRLVPGAGGLLYMAAAQFV